ncbi:MAG TPA: creatininase family protein [Bauldia sp.]|nr:creatininase family protein [Bauldia sp.]
MQTIKSVRLEEYTRETLARHAKETLLVIPTGATEQHGPHLPVGTDEIVAYHLAIESATRVCERGEMCLVAPPLWYGSSHHHIPYPGTLSLAANTFLQAIEDLAVTASGWGIKRLFLLNGHGGNANLLQQAARNLVLKTDLDVGTASYWDLVRDRLLQDPTVADVVKDMPGHAGYFETSVMLALRPELVDVDAYPAKSSAPARKQSFPNRSGPFVQRSPIWHQKAGGISDAPSEASAEIGKRVLEHTIASLTECLLAFRFQRLDGPDTSRPS